MVRGHTDFATLAAYETFVRDAVDRGSRAERVAADRAALRPLPSTPIPSYTMTVIRRWSTIRVAHRTYSVPARLMGHTVEARVHADLVEVRYRGQLVQTMPRLAARTSTASTIATSLAGWCGNPVHLRAIGIVRICFPR